MVGTQTGGLTGTPLYGQPIVNGGNDIDADAVAAMEEEISAEFNDAIDKIEGQKRGRRKSQADSDEEHDEEYDEEEELEEDDLEEESEHDDEQESEQTTKPRNKSRKRKQPRPVQIDAIFNKYGGDPNAISAAKALTDNDNQSLRQEVATLTNQLALMNQGTATQAPISGKPVVPGQLTGGFQSKSDEEISEMSEVDKIKYLRAEQNLHLTQQMTEQAEINRRTSAVENALKDTFPVLNDTSQPFTKGLMRLDAEGAIPNNPVHAVIFAEGLRSIMNNDEEEGQRQRKKGAKTERTRRRAMDRNYVESAGPSRRQPHGRKQQLTPGQREAADIMGMPHDEYAIFDNDDTDKQLAYLNKKLRKKRSA